MEAIAIGGLILFYLVLLFGAVSIFFGIFGTLIIFLNTLIYGFFTNFEKLDLRFLVVLFCLYLAGELLEYIFIVVGAKKFGASTKAIIGGIVGGVVGALVGTTILPIIGTAMGAFLGLFLGAFVVELATKRELAASFKAGAGSFLGRVGAILVKEVIAVVMIIIIIQRIH